jgi:hypothetical protein
MGRGGDRQSPALPPPTQHPQLRSRAWPSSLLQQKTHCGAGGRCRRISPAAPRAAPPEPRDRPGNNGVSGPIALGVMAWRERCRDDRATGWCGSEEEGQAGASADVRPPPRCGGRGQERHGSAEIRHGLTEDQLRGGLRSPPTRRVATDRVILRGSMLDRREDGRSCRVRAGRWLCGAPPAAAGPGTRSAPTPP